MALIWVFRIKSRGATAYLMASAFVVFAGFVYSIKQEAGMPIRIGLGVILALLLGADVAVRAARQAREHDRKQ